MTDRSREYHKSSNFFISNVAYHEHKAKFDYALELFNESEALKEIVSGVKISFEETEANTQVACGLIFVRCQQLTISILRLCNEGNVEDAGILVRALFEHYLQLKHIKKENNGTLFLNFRWISEKRYFDTYERNFPNSDLIISEEFRNFKVRYNTFFERIKKDYLDKNGKPRRHWYKGDLASIARDVNENITYDFIMQINSPFVHCDVSGMERFISGDDKGTIFECSPTTKSLDMILDFTSGFFGRIVTEWATAFKADIPDTFKKYLIKTT
ncbi:MAG: hypothetical protein A2W25_06825 [candidate division Zixibacteria bacterium RBG_16_53_22]|nr:MAG: hypothetical protein A2W25_06825 [candidate division Zixibacteria bacterium RBG_16_53_22]